MSPSAAAASRLTPEAAAWKSGVIPTCVWLGRLVVSSQLMLEGECPVGWDVD
jgi:hypothetical protein